MTDPLAALRTALVDRYAVEWELGRGGMATVYPPAISGTTDPSPSGSPARRHGSPITPTSTQLVSHSRSS